MLKEGYLDTYFNSTIIHFIQAATKYYIIIFDRLLNIVSNIYANKYFNIYYFSVFEIKTLKLNIYLKNML